MIPVNRQCSTLTNTMVLTQQDAGFTQLITLAGLCNLASKCSLFSLRPAGVVSCVKRASCFVSTTALVQVLHCLFTGLCLATFRSCVGVDIHTSVDLVQHSSLSFVSSCTYSTMHHVTTDVHTHSWTYNCHCSNMALIHLYETIHACTCIIVTVQQPQPESQHQTVSHRNLPQSS